MGRLFQITESDLTTLEELAPKVCEQLVMAVCKDKSSMRRARIKANRIKSILSDVRWNYGPPEEAEIIDDNDGLPTQG